MKNFFRYVLATLVGLFLFWVISLLIISGIIGSSIKSSVNETKVTIDPNSILKVEFKSPINDRPTQMDYYSFNPTQFDGNYGLRPMVEAIKRAKTDDRIKGIYLKPDGISTGWSNLTALNDALNDFKNSGKFIVSNSRIMSQKAYGLASTADEIYLHPQGDMMFQGLSSQSMYFKNMLDNLGIQPEVFYAGKFKSATEPLRRTNMSDENRLQVKEFLGDIYATYLDMISKNRNMSVEQLRDIADNLKIRKAEDAVDLGMITATKYDDEVLDILREKVGLDDDDDLPLTSILDYSEAEKLTGKGKNTASNQIAVVYAEGEIGMGDDDDYYDQGISGDRYAKLMRKLRKDKDVKAVVLRVNSPGGSAFASDLIWREIELLKKEKPVIVSMGNVAASGGYYIAANSDRIFAEDNTITGSIGVFGVLFNMERFLNKKLGITTDGVSTGKFSDFPNMTKTWTAEEKAIVQNSIEDIYGDFLGKVAKGRGMTVEQVNEIAQGRVWSGQDALNIGLVDEIGGLEQAIAYAKEKAAIDDPKIGIYPKSKSQWEQLQDMFDLEAKANKMVQKKLGEYGEIGSQIERIKSYSEPQMRLPVDYDIH